MEIDISKNIVESIADSQSLEFSLDIAEFTVDQLLEDSPLRDIPWVGWIFKAKSIYNSISDRVFLAKILRFLIQTSGVQETEKNKFLEKVQTDNKFKTKVATKLLFILNHISDFEKIDIIAIIFCEYLNNRTDFESFCRLSQAIENCYISDLNDLSKNENINMENLLKSGLARIKTSFDTNPTWDKMEITIPLELSDLGVQLQNILKNKDL